jgi:hypothetical protein
LSRKSFFWIRGADPSSTYQVFAVDKEGSKYNTFQSSAGSFIFTREERPLMIRAFNKHYRKAIDLLESSTGTEKMEMAERVMEWFREIPEEYLVSLALFFNEVIDDLGDDSLEKINLKTRPRKKREEEEEEEVDEYEEDEEDYDEDEDEEDY